MKTTFLKWAFGIGLIFSLCLMSYLLGRSHAEVKIVKQKGEEIIKEVEVIKYVDKQKADIWARPNASDAELIGLFMQDKL